MKTENFITAYLKKSVPLSAELFIKLCFVLSESLGLIYNYREKKALAYLCLFNPLTHSKT